MWENGIIDPDCLSDWHHNTLSPLSGQSGDSNDSIGSVLKGWFEFLLFLHQTKLSYHVHVFLILHMSMFFGEACLIGILDLTHVHAVSLLIVVCN